MQQLMENKKTYDFEVHAPSVLGTAYKGVEILGYFAYESALVFAGDLDAIHAEVFSTGQLPVGTPDDPRQYDYYRIKKQDGSITILGEPWIDQASITLVTIATATILVPKVSTTDMIRLRDMMTQAGFIDFSIKFDS